MPSSTAYHRETYRRMATSVRLLNRQRRLAEQLQRKGMTLTEIAAVLQAPRSAVVTSLYSDKVQS